MEKYTNDKVINSSVSLTTTSVLGVTTGTMDVAAKRDLVPVETRTLVARPAAIYCNDKAITVRNTYIIVINFPCIILLL
jgi:hypothetical protein